MSSGRAGPVWTFLVELREQRLAAMQDHGSWSVGLGRWGGVQIRLHAFFLLFAACTLYLGWLADSRGEQGHVALGAFSVGVLLASVLVHDLAHLHIARRLGGGAERLVLGPLGGLQPVRTPGVPQADLIIHLAGPAVNLVVCVICLPWLLSLEGPQHVLGLLHPLQPRSVAVASSPWIVAIQLTFWINWLLFLVNLLPAFLFDGGRMLRSLVELFWEDAGRRYAAVIIGACAQLAAIGLLIAAFLCRNQAAELFPVWFPLVLLSILLFFSSRTAETPRVDPPAADQPFGYDFSQGYTSLEKSTQQIAPPPPPGLWQRWRQQRRDARQQRQQRVEADEERRVDEILDRLHQHGLDKLSAEDRALLERVSVRYRNRQRDQAV
ncbi:MAG: site-2 protease family protein [Pirellulaceae bacterium]|nr:site-2 protease family protein [Pirellulaceae bacterium]